MKDLSTVLLDRVCVDVDAEPDLLNITGEKFDLRTAKNEDDAT